MSTGDYPPPPPPPPGSYPPPPPPPGDYPPYTGVDISRAAARVKGPAITLIVITGLGILGQLVSMVANLAGMRSMPANLPPDAERWVSFMSGGLGVVATVLTLAVGGLIIFGAMKMMNLQNYGLAMAVSIVAMVPCLSPCCCLGLPAGIWAIITLTNAEVKAAFR